MKHDDAEIYFLEFTSELPNKYGGRHMALFLEWAMARGLASNALMEFSDSLSRGKNSALDFLFEQCDGKLTDEDLTDEGNAFVESFYARDYLPAYIRIIGCKPDDSAAEIFAIEPSPMQRACVHWTLDRHYSKWLRGYGLLPRQELLDRCLAKIQPVAEAAGFPRVQPSLRGSHIVCAEFERATRTGRVTFTLIVEDDPEWFYGLQVRLTVHDDPLRQAIYAEKKMDLGNVTQIQVAAEIPLSRLAAGWAGPLQLYDSYRPCFWIFRLPEFDALLDWLAERLTRFALPTLRELDSLDALALAYGTKPMSASPIHSESDPYPALITFEQARHPRLASLLEEAEQNIRSLEPRERTANQHGALALVDRIRQRSRHLL